MASIVFVINLVVTVWGSVAPRSAGGVLDQGNCGRIKTLNSGLHILINVFSTILLSGSNYCMQCMSAPTRGEIDRSHIARKWLDVGVPSFRNLKRIDRRRLLLWLYWVQAPFHFIFCTFPAHIWNALLIACQVQLGRIHIYTVKRLRHFRGQSNIR
jgi:hypothetical protein